MLFSLKPSSPGTLAAESERRRKMPAGIYHISKSKNKYTLITRCSLDKVLNDDMIRKVVGPLGTLTPAISGTPVPYVDSQGWPIPPSVSAPAQKWYLSEENLLDIAARHPEIAPKLGGLSRLDPATHRWATNITPNRKASKIGIAFLAEIKEVWGYRYLGWTAQGGWTPIMVKFKVLWLDTPLTPPDFTPPAKDEDPVPEFPTPKKIGRSFFEFFYISRKGGLVTTTSYSQAALFPDALEYFVGEMRKSLLRPPDECGEGKDIICP
jgi:hypothetical protein